MPDRRSVIGGPVRRDGAGAPGGPPKAEPGAGSARRGAAQRRRLIVVWVVSRDTADTADTPTRSTRPSASGKDARSESGAVRSVERATGIGPGRWRLGGGLLAEFAAEVRGLSEGRPPMFGIKGGARSCVPHRRVSGAAPAVEWRSQRPRRSAPISIGRFHRLVAQSGWRRRLLRSRRRRESCRPRRRWVPSRRRGAAGPGDPGQAPLVQHAVSPLLVLGRRDVHCL